MNVALDFDGVLHHDLGAWRGVSHINGAPVHGAAEFLHALWRAGHDVVVFTCRGLEPAGHDAVVRWLVEHFGDDAPPVVAEKPVAHLYIDDRGFRFEGAFPSMDDVERLCQCTWMRNDRDSPEEQ